MEATPKEKFHASRIMSGLMVCLFLSALDNSIVATAMPKIIADLKGMEFYSLPFTTYLLFSTVILPVSGKLSDLFGRKKILMWAMSLFLVFSMFCGLSFHMGMLAIARGFQGACGGMISSSAFIITTEIFPKEKQGRYMGALASMYGLANLLGPVAGGLITQYLSWHWIFFLNVPLGIVAVFLLRWNLPALLHPENSAHIDWKGILFYLLALIPFLFTLSEMGKLFSWHSMIPYLLFTISILMIYIFRKTELRSSSPLIRQQLLSHPVFQKAAFAGFLTYVPMFGMILYVPYLLQVVMNRAVAFSGMMLMVMCIAMVIGSMFSGMRASHSNRLGRLGASGMAVCFIGLVIFYFSPLQIPIYMLIVCLALIGWGIGMNFPLFSMAPRSVFPAGELGVVISTIQFFEVLGGVVSVAVVGFLLHTSLKSIILIGVFCMLIAMITMYRIDKSIEIHKLPLEKA